MKISLKTLFLAVSYICVFIFLWVQLSPFLPGVPELRYWHEKPTIERFKNQYEAEVTFFTKNDSTEFVVANNENFSNLTESPITHLTLKGINAPKCLDELGNFPKLEFLTIAETNLVNLNDLPSANFPFLDLDDNLILRSLDGIENLKSLRSLHVSDSRYLSDVSALFKLTSMHQLNIEGESSISRSTIDKLKAKFPKLNESPSSTIPFPTLDLRFCPQLRPREPRIKPDDFGKEESLFLKEVYAILDQYFEDFVRHRLNIDRDKLSDVEASQIADLANSILQKLNSKFSDKIVLHGKNFASETVGKYWRSFKAELPLRFKIEINSSQENEDKTYFTISHYDSGIHMFDFYVENGVGVVTDRRYDSLGNYY